MATSFARAGSFSVNPVKVELSPDKRVAALEVRNNGAEATAIQLELLAWSQNDEGENYQPTQTLLATPPIFSIAPGESQIVRVGLRHMPRADHELSFRIFLQEIPAPDANGGGGLRMALRVGIPVFFQPKGFTPPELQWSAVALVDGGIELQARNGGGAHQKLDALAIRNASGTFQPVASAAYVLPGAARQWRFNPESSSKKGDVVEVHAKSRGNTQQLRIRVE